jgi:multidrug resistance efflux pump
LTDFNWSPFEEVDKGDTLTTIVRSDSSYLQARLDLISAMIMQIEQGMEPVINRQRNIIDYENLKLDNLQQRIDLASSRIREQQLKSEFERAQRIYELDGLSESELERIRSDYQIVQTEVEQRAEVVDTLAGRLKEIEKYIIGEDAGTPLSAAVEVYEKELKVVEEELKPRTIFAPMSGVISKIYKGNGQYTRAGEPILSIESSEPSYILGYVRQPFDIVPKIGMEVQVRTRKPSRDFFKSYITRIGAQIRPMGAELRRPGINTESGLPVQISIENAEDLRLYPGEVVDIVLLP